MKNKLFAVMLGFGLSLATASANAVCTTACGEMLRDCLAQTGNTAFCHYTYRLCLQDEGCI